jgi:hypothetical protein
MKLRMVVSAVLVALLISCTQPTTAPPGGGRGTNKGTIVLYRDKSNVCRTVTTPFFKAKKNESSGNPGKADWKVDDEFTCITSGLVVRIRFDKGDPSPCEADPEGDNNLTCRFRRDVDAPRDYSYSVYFDASKEDPELQIEM